MKASWLFLLAVAAGLAQAQPAPVAPAAPPAAPTAPAPPAEVGRVYAPGPFDRLELAGAARVTLVQGDRDQAFIAGDAEVQKTVDVVLSDRQLVIRPVGGWKFWNSGKLQIRVEMSQVRQLTLSGASDLHAPGPLRADQLKLSIRGSGLVRLDQLRADKLAFDISGAGDGHLAGRVDELVLRISGKGKVLADQLRAERAGVSISGIGHATLWVIDDLAATISGVGSVDYFGHPQVQRSVSGMGSISSKGDRR